MTEQQPERGHSHNDEPTRSLDMNQAVYAESDPVSAQPPSAQPPSAQPPSAQPAVSVPADSTGTSSPATVGGRFLTGIVAEFNFDRGLGVILGHNGTRFPFHCTAIADGSRMIGTGVEVVFILVRGHLGKTEAANVVAMMSLRAAG